MSLRMAALATFIAVLPLSVDAPGDSTPSRTGETRVTVAGSLGQYGIVNRGCNGEILDVARRQLRSGALVIEHETPQGIVIGVRGGEVQEHGKERIYTPYGSEWSEVSRRTTNRYVNPFLAYEGTYAGVGGGWLRTEHGILNGRGGYDPVDGSGHLRLGRRDRYSLTLRVLEDVPLQSEGAVVFDLDVPGGRFEGGPTLAAGSPYDGALFGVHGRIWLTPAAAASIRAGVGDYSQYYVTGGLTARWPAPR